MIEFSDRLKRLPPYIFAEIDKIKQEEAKKGRKLISLGIGDPDLPTPDFVLDAMNAAIKKPEHHRYPSYGGLPAFRQAVAKWFEERFGVRLDADTEVLTLIGSKEGIAHLPLAFVNPGEATLVPDPGYPVYAVATAFAGGVARTFRLEAKNGFLPDLGHLESLVKSGPKTRLLFLNYPNNPTAACAGIEFFTEVARFAKKHEIIVCHDNAYSEIYFDGKRQPSFLEAPGAKEVGVEFHSFSKTFNMAGWRVGYVVGNAKVIAALAQIKTNMDSGVFHACLEAGIAALEKGGGFCKDLRSIYQKRRDILVPALQEIGLQCESPQATFYVWARIASQKGSKDFVTSLIRDEGIVATPGTGFGEAGEGYVRFTLCSDAAVLKQVAEALRGSV